GDFWFCDSSFSNSVCPTRINPGDTVTWQWVGNAPHTTTACSDGTFTTCGAAQGWDSPVMTSGTFSRTFNNTGSFYYRCQIHTSMHGRIDVIQDTDGDGWSDAAEAIIGTDPSRKCGPNAWPPDINSDGHVDIIRDISPVAGEFGKNVPQAPARYDIAPDPPNGLIDVIGDISRLAGLFGQSCMPSRPPSGPVGEGSGAGWAARSRGHSLNKAGKQR